MFNIYDSVVIKKTNQNLGVVQGIMPRQKWVQILCRHNTEKRFYKEEEIR